MLQQMLLAKGEFCIKCVFYHEKNMKFSEMTGLVTNITHTSQKETDFESDNSL